MPLKILYFFLFGEGEIRIRRNNGFDISLFCHLDKVPLTVFAIQRLVCKDIRSWLSEKTGLASLHSFVRPLIAASAKLAHW